MTHELKMILDKEISDALESNDEGRINRCTARYIQAIGDCQQKTSDRVKSIKSTTERNEQAISEIKTELSPLKSSCDQFQSIMLEKKIVCKWLKWLKWLGTAVVGIIGYEGVHYIIDIIQKVNS